MPAWGGSPEEIGSAGRHQLPGAPPAEFFQIEAPRLTLAYGGRLALHRCFNGQPIWLL
jgi:hypothetical protein